MKPARRKNRNFDFSLHVISSKTHPNGTKQQSSCQDLGCIPRESEVQDILYALVIGHPRACAGKFFWKYTLGYAVA
jgi:hypothetical protein